MKKIILFIAGILSLTLVMLDYVGTYIFCDYFISDGHNGACPFLMSDIEAIIFPIIPMFIFSLITYKMKEDVYQTWWKFSRVWIPLSMLMILMAPSYSSNWMIPIEKGTVAFFSSIIYGAISVYIIIYHLSKRK